MVYSGWYCDVLVDCTSWMGGCDVERLCLELGFHVATSTT